MRIVAPAQLDELGEYEEFSWDLFLVVPAEQTRHLDANGLPKIGTLLTPGMIVVGKIGKTKRYNASRRPTTLEIHSLHHDVLLSRYGMMWKDGSIYADKMSSGIVRSSVLEIVDSVPTAIVEVEAE